MNKHEEDAKVFKAFCDENRLEILNLLRSGEKCACVILEELDIAQSTLSHHMKILCESGIVDNRKEGKWTHYFISDKGTEYAKALLTELTTLTDICECKGNCSCS
jgi:ArsR family transcriptional regulator